jgi:hypothetical protein
MNDDFYKKEVFDMFKERFDKIEDTLKLQGNDISDIRNKIYWVYGAAAAITLAANVGWLFIKEKIFRI